MVDIDGYLCYKDHMMTREERIMIFDYVLDLETGRVNDRLHFDTECEAIDMAERMVDEWDYVTVRRRTMDPVTMADTYELVWE